jgi:hypothetical protein
MGMICADCTPSSREIGSVTCSIASFFATTREPDAHSAQIGLRYIFGRTNSFRSLATLAPFDQIYGKSGAFFNQRSDTESSIATTREPDAHFAQIGMKYLFGRSVSFRSVTCFRGMLPLSTHTDRPNLRQIKQILSMETAMSLYSASFSQNLPTRSKGALHAQ